MRIELNRRWAWIAAYLAICGFNAGGQEILPSLQQLGPVGEPAAATWTHSDSGANVDEVALRAAGSTATSLLR